MRWRGPGATVNYRPDLVREGATTNPQLSKENFNEKENLVAGPRRAPDTKTDCHDVTLAVSILEPKGREAVSSSEAELRMDVATCLLHSISRSCA
jgi:hypothetical protein